MREYSSSRVANMAARATAVRRFRRLHTRRRRFLLRGPLESPDAASLHPKQALLKLFWPPPAAAASLCACMGSGSKWLGVCDMQQLRCREQQQHGVSIWPRAHWRVKGRGADSMDWGSRRWASRCRGPVRRTYFWGSDGGSPPWSVFRGDLPFDCGSHEVRGVCWTELIAEDN